MSSYSDEPVLVKPTARGSWKRWLAIAVALGVTGAVIYIPYNESRLEELAHDAKRGPRQGAVYPLTLDGAAHTIDIQFVFRGFHGGPLGVNIDQVTGQPRELNADEARLSDEMIAAWTRFADRGDPSGPKQSQAWPRFTGGNSGIFLVQDTPLSTKRVSEFRNEYQCEYWDGFLPLPN